MDAPNSTLKQCSRKDKCINPLGSWLPATSEFWQRDRSKAFGLASACKCCVLADGKRRRKEAPERKKAAAKRYYEKHRDEIKEKTLAYYYANHEELKAKKRQYGQVHKEEIAQKQRAYRNANPEEYLARHRISSLRYYYRNRDKYRAWRKANPNKPRQYQSTYYQKHKSEIAERGKRYRQNSRDQVRVTNANWRKRNPDKVRDKERRYAKAHPEKLRLKWRVRSARERAGSGSHSQNDVEVQYRSQKGRCWWCGDSLNGVFHVDHIIPLARGGSNNPDNICCSCAPCNLSKGSKLPYEWRGRLF